MLGQLRIFVRLGRASILLRLEKSIDAPTCIPTLNRTWVVSDSCGNSAEMEEDIMVVDGAIHFYMAPIVENPEDLGDTRMSTMQDTFGYDEVKENCGDDVDSIYCSDAVAIDWMSRKYVDHDRGMQVDASSDDYK